MIRAVMALAMCCEIIACSPASVETKEEDREAAPPVSPPAAGRPKMWVTTEKISRRTCPSIRCGSVGWLSFGEAVEPLERRDGWVRITKQYDASCQADESQYVDDGDKSCTPQNGVVDGRMAEWVPESALSVTRPADPAKDATADESIVAQSDDFARHHATFAKVAHQLFAMADAPQPTFKRWVVG